jgi:hypothetical protein
MPTKAWTRRAGAMIHPQELRNEPRHGPEPNAHRSARQALGHTSVEGPTLMIPAAR